MESIDILTGQHITIKYEPASIVQRLLAIFLDFLFMGVYLSALIYILVVLLKINIDIFQLDAVSIVFGILCLPILCYHVLFESLMNGQTPGKFIAKIRVTNIDGSTPNFVSYFLRWILLPVDLLYGIGALLIIFTKNHQRLGDLAAGTTVVKLVPSSAKYNFDPLFNEFSEDYQPTFPQVETLTEGQIRFISQLLEKPSKEPTVIHSIDELALKIKQKLNIETKMGSRDFLEMVVRDYSYY